MEITQLDRIERMLGAQLRSDNRIQWIGGYAHGRTSNDDPFITLYPAADYLKFQVCRVYEQDFRKLPDFIETERISERAPEQLKDRDDAIRRGVYVECPRFAVLTYDGKDTGTMGREKRFHHTLYVTQSAIPAQPQAPAPQQKPQAQRPAPPQPQTATVPPWEEAGDDLFGLG